MALADRKEEHTSAKYSEIIKELSKFEKSTMCKRKIRNFETDLRNFQEKLGHFEGTNVENFEFWEIFQDSKESCFFEVRLLLFLYIPIPLKVLFSILMTVVKKRHDVKTKYIC